MFGQADTATEDAAVLGIVMPPQAEFVLWAVHAPVHRLLCLAGRQWRMAGMGVVLGLDMPAVKLIADALHIDWDANLVQSLAIVEAAACAEMAS